MILKMVHSKPESTLFWYIDDLFIGNTKDIHEIAVLPKRGKHTLTVVDEYGNEAKRYFEISK